MRPTNNGQVTRLRPRERRDEVSLDPKLLAVDEFAVYSWPGFNRPRRRLTFKQRVALAAFAGIVVLFVVAAAVSA